MCECVALYFLIFLWLFGFPQRVRLIFLMVVLFSSDLMVVEPPIKININRVFLCIWLMFFFAGYSSSPIHPLGCLELEAFFLFQGQRPPPPPSLSLSLNPYSKAHLSPPPPPPPPFFFLLSLCVTLLCHLSFISYNIYIMSHSFHINVMPTFFQALDITHSQKDKWISSPSHFSLFNCSLSVIL